MLESTLHATGRSSPSVEELTERIQGLRQFPATVELAWPTEHDLAWLQNQHADFRLAWRNRGESSFVFAVGAAKRICSAPGQSASTVIHRCRTALQGLPDQRMYGGFAFGREEIWENSPWQHFGAASFWLPRATLRDKRLQIVVLSELDRTAALRFVRRLSPSGSAAEKLCLPRWTRRIDRPDRVRWEACLDEAMALFRSEVLEKVVLGRQVELTFESPLCPWTLFGQLAQRTPECYHFCFQPRPQLAFLGASPERLFRRQGDQLQSEVVAGTRPRGFGPQQDLQLGLELLASSKDQLEHDIVRKSIRQRLHACVEWMDVDVKASLLRLANKQHLCSHVVARLQPGIDDGALIDRLHPTPAVGGYPTENALDEIRRLEPFQRGWYSGPVGWIGPEAAEFAVAIRSGLVDHDHLTLYSAAGIVPGSTAEAEWDEIEHKVSDFLQLLSPAGSAADNPSG